MNASLNAQQFRLIDQTIEEYTTIERNQRMDLLLKIGEMIREGWQPYGSLVVINDGFKMFYIQPMVKYNKTFVLERGE